MKKTAILKLLAALLLVLFWAIGCDKGGPIRIGFVAGLTGRTSDLGIAGRNGVLLAVEKMNEAGGINGRKIELRIKDDAHNPETAEKVVRELLAEKVSAIIGPMTSQMAIATQPIINTSQTVMVSPTTSTNLLNDQDDNFFRIYPSSQRAAAELAEYARRNLGLQTTLAVYDLKNSAHTESWYKSFTSYFQDHGGEVLEPITFTSGSGFSFYQLAEQIAAQPAGGAFILANAIDTAMICQQLRKLNYDKPIMATEWSGTEDLTHFGGSSVNGLSFFHSIDRDNRTPDYTSFVKSFEARFGQKPGFASVHSFDATRLVLTALAKNPDPALLKQTLLQMGHFEGLQGPLKFTETGDIERQLYLIQIEDGEFRTQNYP